MVTGMPWFHIVHISRLPDSDPLTWTWKIDPGPRKDNFAIQAGIFHVHVIVSESVSPVDLILSYKHLQTISMMPLC